MPRHPPSSIKPASFFIFALAYCCFVIYGSLVPLDLVRLPFEEALARFKAIPYLDLGMESRADWVANILLYIPLAFLTSATFSGVRNPAIRALASLFVLVFCLSLAVSIEFIQLYFPPRTVSVNDLIAETIGTVTGILIWQVFGRSFIQLYGNISLGNFVSVKSASIFYLLSYVTFSLFPFDFVTSYAELDLKLAGGNDHFILSTESFNAPATRTLVKWLVEITALLPLGGLIGAWPYLTHRTVLSVSIGFFLGIFLETVQLFLVSGTAEGESVLTRMAGMGLGTQLFSWASRQNRQNWNRWLRPLVVAAIGPYILLAITVNGWFSGNWLDKDQALTKLAETQFLPFYYFYYTTETIALVSLLNNAGTYIPVGLFFWMWSFASHRAKKTHWFFVGLSAAVFAVFIETVKLFLVNKHADPTDVLIAFVAAVASYAFINRTQELLSKEKLSTKERKSLWNGHNTNHENLNGSNNRPRTAWFTELMTGEYTVNKKGCWISMALLAVIGSSLFQYPSGSLALTGFLALYCCLLYLFPQSWLFAVPALLPVMDFTPWTGRFFFDEFDLVILTTIMMCCWRKPKQNRPNLQLSIKTIFIFGLFIFCYFISLLKGLLPLQTMDANAFSSYYSNYNALRTGKGFVWFLLLLPFLAQNARQHGERAKSYFGAGVIIGLAGVVCFAVAERLVFPGLFDFSTDYRVNALFSTMHTGGGHIESYLALSLPFIVLLFFKSRHINLGRIFGISLYTTGVYVLLVTFSRGGYIGLGIGFIVLSVGLLVSRRHRLLAMKNAFLLISLLMAIVAVLAVPVSRGALIQQRFSVAHQDKEIREKHWRDAIAMMDDSPWTTVFGMGVGSFPRTYFWLNTENDRSATYKIENENQNAFLRLTGGDSLYFGQYIDIKAQTAYRLAMDMRRETDKTDLTVFVCEKSIQYSFRCNSTAIAAAEKTWTHVEQVIDSDQIGSQLTDIAVAGAWLKRPVQLSLYIAGDVNKIVDVDNVKLLDPSGVNLIANGDFSEGTDFWYFSTEKHNPWHIFNLWVHVLFDLGWLGLLAFVLMLISAFYNLCNRLPTDPFAAVLLASLSGFMVVGFVDSPFDAPRLTLLFSFVMYFSLKKCNQPALQSAD